MPVYTPATLRLEFHSNNEQSIKLSPALWREICPSDSDTQITVSVKVPSLTAAAPVALSETEDGPLRPSGLQSFLAHATLAEEDKPSEKRYLYASASLIRAIYGDDALTRLDEDEDDDDDIDGNGEEAKEHDGYQVLVKPASILELDEIIVGALNVDSFEYAQQDHESLAALFSTGQNSRPLIIRSGGRYTFQTTDDTKVSFRVLMTGPVQQGYMISAEHTKILAVDISTSVSESSTPDLKINGDGHLESFSVLETLSTSDTVEPREFIPRILSWQWPESRLFPAPSKQDDDESRIFIGVKDLAKCGVFSGGWILVSSSDTKKSRLCRVYGVDIIDQINEHEERSIIYLPPVLYFNLGLPLPPSTADKTVALIRLTIPPPADGPPSASTVNIAKVASPASMDKALQGAFLDALRLWFEEKERILCKGDLIAITLDEETARLRPKDDEESIQKGTNRPTTVAYFKVTSLEDDAGSKQDDIHPAFYGHGRRIVPSQTKLVQTGTEHSRVPSGSISHFYNLVNKLPLMRTATPAYKEVYELISSSLHPLGRDFQLSCNALVQGPRGGGKTTMIREVAEELGVHLYEFSAYDVVSETDAKTEVHLRAKFDKAAALSPCIVLIKSIEGLAKKSAVVETGQEPLLANVLQECIKNVNAAHATTGYPVMVIATTSDVDALPSSILGCFRHEVAVEAPDEKTRLHILQNLTFESPLAPDVSLSSLATQTAALVGKDLVDLLARAGVLALQRINKSIHKENGASVTPSDIECAGLCLTAADFDAALSEARASYSDSIGAPKIPNVTWDDVGGLASVKDDILDTIQLPLEHPELFGAGLKKRSGILLYGPPGTGKTLLAKAIATSCSLNFFSVKGPELLNMYIGESEANVRRVFQKARDAKPCVVFFDELDSVAPKRGEKGDSGGVMDRIVSQLLAELDGMSEGGEGSGVGDVFVIGATNRPDLLDPALLRPGRFDKLLYLGVSQDHESQLRIIQALTRKFRLHPDLDLARIAERCPFHYTGADFYALCSDAMLKAMTRVAEAIDAKVKQLNEEKRPDLPDPVTAQYYLSRLATKEEIMVQVEEIDFVKALEELVPSVSATELEHYQRVREKFEQSKDEDDVNEQQGNHVDK
ncbi:hypothetical protein VTP01DRAFT_5557 [Rhizomucor pusillus]|uniref:uncharacterized protein n=1 Tax=Rhizomucor pusillus TaxID=4840 RepID=UPI003744A08A